MEKQRCSFISIESFFEKLNKAGVRYLVLRNFENLLTPELYLDGHGDIDLLCDDTCSLVKAVGAIPCPPKSSLKLDDKIHYKIFVNNQPVSLDLRQVGDGYYCEEWERDLLECRVRCECFYVMNPQDYFFTLAYHSILQKRFLSEDYRLRLIQMSKVLGLEMEAYNEKCFIYILQQYMKKKGYRFSFSSDYMVPNRFHLVDNNLVSRNLYLQWLHFVFELKISVIGLLVRIKHLLFH